MKKNEKFKTYAMNIDGKIGGLVYTTSKTKAAKAFDVSMYFFNQHGGVTSNSYRNNIASVEPEVPLFYDLQEYTNIKYFKTKTEAHKYAIQRKKPNT